MDEMQRRGPCHSAVISNGEVAISRMHGGRGFAVRCVMTSKNANTDAKQRARAAVATLKQRIAKQEGVAAPDEHAAEDADHTPVPSHVTRAQAHPAARTQRPQGRREGK